MSDKKNIDRLFQEKFKDFEATPSPSVWNAILKKLLTNKSQRKAIPIWWKFAGVAAGLLLLFSIWNLVINPNDSTPEQKIVNTESENPISEDLNQKQSTTVDAPSSEESVDEKDVQDSPINSNAIANTKASNSTLSLSKNKQAPLISSIKNVSQKPNAKSTLDESLVKSAVKDANTNNALVTLESNTEDTVGDKSRVESTLNDIPSALSKTVENSNSTEETSENGDLSITEAITENNVPVALENKKKNKWSVAPTIAPVYFNTLGDGSSLHEQFNDNPKTGAINMSYGISTSYAINSKLSVRAGVHKVNLGYSTNNVVTYNNLSSVSNKFLLKNIAFKKEAQSISFISADEFSFAIVPNIISNNIKASIDQKLGFIEVPVELQYSITNTKFGVSIVGGFSALILSNNDIYSVQGGQSILLGKATNINNLSYSANFGLGLDYKVSKKINFNLEPIFKYQLNTFNNTSGNFKPYFIGVYSGFSFKF